jgi:CelD/BcsL family acetyltransferase involved in cellulose biosynthesis
MRLTRLSSIEQLRQSAGAWDDLWERSEWAAPSARAEPLAHWLRTFAPGARLELLAVEHDGRLAAALPLYASRIGRVVRAAQVPQNPWSSAGELLVDPRHQAAALDAIAAHLARSSWPLVWLDHVPYEQPAWQHMAAALEGAGLAVSVQPQDRVPQVQRRETWSEFEAGLKGDHRRSRRRYARLLEEAGGARLDIERPTDPGQIERLIRTAFEVEDRSWKGAAGTSVLKNRGMLEFYQRQAVLLAADGHLEIALLVHRDQPIASAYLWHGKGVWYVAKLGYDEVFRQFGPGQQLIARLIERLHQSPDFRLLDFWGFLAPWNESWATRVYPVGRIVAAPNKTLSRTLFFAYRKWSARRERRLAAAAASTST